MLDCCGPRSAAVIGFTATQAHLVRPPELRLDCLFHPQRSPLIKTRVPQCEWLNTGLHLG